jgi:hypothetical protein
VRMMSADGRPSLPQGPGAHRHPLLRQRAATGGFPPIPIDFPGKLAFTTEVSVWPQTFPYPECTGKVCGDSLC